MIGSLVATGIALFGLSNAIFSRGRDRFYRIPMLACILLGGICNSTAMLANHYRMPVVGPHIQIPQSDTSHCEATASTRLLWLTDTHGPVWARYSLGDMVLSVGFLVALFWGWRELFRMLRK